MAREFIKDNSVWKMVYKRNTSVIAMNLALLLWQSIKGCTSRGLLASALALLAPACVADLPPNSIGQNALLALLLANKCPTLDYEISAPRFGSINTPVQISVPSDKSGSFTQTEGDTVTILGQTASALTFQVHQVPAATLAFQFTESSKATNCGSLAARITILESTANPTYVDANYTGGSSDGSLERPYTDVAAAYSAAPGAVYMASGNYPITATLTLQAGKSIYGGFTSSFERVNDRSLTVIDDTRVGIASAYTIDSGSGDSNTRFDGLTVNGATNSNLAAALFCNSGAPVFNNLAAAPRTNMAVTGSIYGASFGNSCNATLQNSRLQAPPNTSAWCAGLNLNSANATIKNNQLLGNSCGRPAGILILANGVTLSQYNYIHATGSNTAYTYGIHLASVSGVMVANQWISAGSGGTGAARGIFLENTGAITITDNIIYGGSSANVTGISLNAAAGLATIRRNTIIGGDQNGNGASSTSVMGVYLGSAQNHIITNNVIVLQSAATSSIGVAFDFAGVTSPVIVNNTIISKSSPSGVNSINLRNDATPIIANNIIASESSIGYHIAELHVGTDPSILENNLLFNYPQGLYYDQGVGFHTTAAAVNAMGDIPTNSGNMTTTPVNGIDLKTIFVDPDHLDFRLQSGSPWATAGKNVYGNATYGSITTNRSGEARPSGGSWSVGAY
ncbi:MAG: hypothetical protein KDK39_15975 [Leptospiraceae bacterium]|nr:hypothetical protein [Leptospiraceae bacterium]